MPHLQRFCKITSGTGSYREPVLIITPLSESDVPPAVICAEKLDVEIRIRSGGHDYEGLSYESKRTFIILDMFNLRDIDIDIASETAWVQAGATIGELYYKVSKASPVHGFPASVCPHVGFGGHIGGGGYGSMIRRYGLAADNVVDARVVDVNGRIMDRMAMGEDLFWAIRGVGAASFVVVLAFKIELVRVPESVTYLRVERYLDQTSNFTDLILQYQDAATKIDDSLFLRLLLSVENSTKHNQSNTIKASFVGLYLGDSTNLTSIVNNEFPGLGLKPEEFSEMSWIESVLITWANFDNGTKPEALLLNRTAPGGSTFFRRKSDYLLKPIPKEGLNSLFEKMMKLGDTGLTLNPYGGRMAEIPATQLPFPHRVGVMFKVQYAVNWDEEDEAADLKYTSQIRELHSFMTPFVSSNPRQAYLNYRDLDIGINDHGIHSCEEGKVYGEKYFMGNFERLVKVKSMGGSS